MFSHRRLPLALAAAGACLLLASGAPAAPGDTFTATLTPSHVKPSTSGTYTMTLTTSTGASTRADRATISIPDGFTVGSVTANTTAGSSGNCVPSAWTPNVNSDRIRLDDPSGGGSGDHLCPGAKLTVTFQATSPATDGSFTWNPELEEEEEEVEFTLIGPAPTITVASTTPAKPTVTIEQRPPNPSNSRSAAFTFSTNEATSVACKLDGGGFQPCTSPATYNGLGDGTHTFTVRGSNAAGDTDASYTWTVDATAPLVTIAQKPPSVSNSRSAAFTFSADEPSSFECQLDAGGFQACTSPKSYDGLADGSHTFKVRATNTGGTSDTSYTWTVDATVPVATILQKPLDPSNSSSASFGFIVSESAATACKLDNAEFSSCSSPVSYINLADGRHTFTLRATDAAGNTGEASYSWTSETRAPTAAIASGPAALSNSRSATFTFSADEPSSFACDLDGGGFQPCTSPASYGGLADGAHTFTVRATDAVGNTGAAASHGWTIDATPPETALGSAPRSGTTAVSATFTFSASEPATFECKLDAAAFAPCASPRSYTGLSRGAHSFEVRAIDAAANVDPAAAVHRWTIGALRRAKATSALLAPRAGARVTRPPLLAWRRAPRATYYNVQLFRGSVKVLSSWPVRTRLQLRSRWTYLRRQRRLSPGVYRWYVWPGYGRAAASRYGRLLGQSTFTVARR
jgi:hypothetical protein